MKKRSVMSVLCLWGVGVCTLLVGAGGGQHVPTRQATWSAQARLDGPLQLLLQTPKAQLQRLSQYAPSLFRLINAQGQIPCLLQIKAGRSLKTVPGVQIGTRIGDVYAIRATRAALLALSLRPEVLRIEASQQHVPHRQWAASSVVAHRSTLNKSTKERVYRFSPSLLGTGATANVSFHLMPGYSYRAKKSEINPILSLCADPKCETVLDTDIALHGAKLPAGMKDKYPKPLSHARLSYRFDAKSSKAVYVRVQTISINSTGRFVLSVMSDDVVLVSQDLKGGDVSPFRGPSLAGIRAAHARRVFQTTGKGTIVAVIDTGIDWCHQDFRRKDGSSRILWLWDQTLRAQNGDKSPDVGSDGDRKNDYGVEYNKAQIDAALKDKCDFNKVRSNDTNGHGTHVASTAAGSGTQPGIAPDADLIIVKYTFQSNNMPAALAYVRDKARLAAKPFVINMSLGSTGGPTDGSSLSERAVTALVGPGRNVVISAGNSGTQPLHAEGSIATGNTEELSVQFVRSTLSRGGFFYLYTDAKDTYTLELTAPSGQRFKAKWGQRFNQTVGEAQIALQPGVINLGKTRGTIFGVRFSKPRTATEVWKLSITRTGGTGTGRFDAYRSTDRYNTSRFTSHTRRYADGSYVGSIGSPGSSPGSLTVGSYRLRHLFDIPNNKYRFFRDFALPGEMSSFSSRGPSRDGRPVLDIVAPGEYIGAARSSQRNVDYSTLVDTKYRAIQGTSMAAPVVAGAAALAMEKNKQVFVRPLFRHRAIKPGCCPRPNQNIWGAGLLNIRASLDKLVKSKPPQPVTLVTEDGKVESPFPFVAELRVRSAVPLAEYHWDLNNSGTIDAITTVPRYTLTLGRVQQRKITVRAFNDAGLSVTASLTLKATLKVQELIAEPSENPQEKNNTTEKTATELVPEEVQTEIVGDLGRESSSPDAGIEAAKESVNSQERTVDAGPLADSKTIDAAPQDTNNVSTEKASESKTELNAGGGCGCTTTMTSGPPWLWAWCLLCLCLLGVVRRRQP